VQTAGDAGGDISVRIVATEDFGSRVVLDERATLPPGTSAMEALQQVADIETRYGGGFVNAINGVRSQFPTKDDWFIYANGISMNRGAADYVLRDGDVLQFDLHDWGFRMFIPAIIGDLRGSLSNGYSGRVYPTVVVYEAGFREGAERLSGGLEELGVAEISTVSADSLSSSDKQHSNLIVVGTGDCSLISDLNRVWDRLGFFIRFDDGAIVVYNSEGKPASEYGAGTGVVQATQSPWNPKGIGVSENVVWMVSGTDRAGVESAIDALAEDFEALDNAFAAVVADGDVVRVPR
jgi:hypothetical protein